MSTEYDDYVAQERERLDRHEAIIEEDAKKRTLYPWSVGPFETKGEAINAANTIRRRFKREYARYGPRLVKVSVRPLWKEVGR